MSPKMDFLSVASSQVSAENNLLVGMMLSIAPGWHSPSTPWLLQISWLDIARFAAIRNAALRELTCPSCSVGHRDTNNLCKEIKGRLPAPKEGKLQSRCFI